MTGIVQRVSVIGLCVLIIFGTHGPISNAAIGTAQAASPGDPASSSPAVPTPDPSAPNSSTPNSSATSQQFSTSYSLLPQQFALEVSPTQLTVGQADFATVQHFQVVNRGQSPQGVTVLKSNFRSRPDGTLVYQDDAPYAAAEWITASPLNFTVAPGETQVVTATIRVPVKPETGDHGVVLIFLVPAGKDKGNIKVNRGIATPIFIAVPGLLDSSATLKSLSVPHFATSGPVTISAQIANTGTVHRDFRGGSALGVSVAGSVGAFPDFTVVRGSVRNVSTSWNPPFMCVCHPSVTIVNADGTSSSIKVQVIVFPLQLLGLGIAVLLLLALVMFVLRRRSGGRVQVAARGPAIGSAGGSA